VESPDSPGRITLLDTAVPGSDSMAGQAVLPSVIGAGAFEDVPALSPNGEVVVGVASNLAASHAPPGSVVAFARATGKPAVLFRASPGDRRAGEHRVAAFP
jgi:hypothetical protein